MDPAIDVVIKATTPVRLIAEKNEFLVQPNYTAQESTVCQRERSRVTTLYRPEIDGPVLVKGVVLLDLLGDVGLEGVVAAEAVVQDHDA